MAKGKIAVIIAALAAIFVLLVAIDLRTSTSFGLTVYKEGLSVADVSQCARKCKVDENLFAQRDRRRTRRGMEFAGV